MTKSEQNLHDIIASLPSDTPEIQHIVLKSQVNRKQRVSLQNRR